MDNIMPQMMGELSQILKLSKVYPDTPTFNESRTGPYKDWFIQVTTQYIK